MIQFDIPVPQNCGDCPCAHIFDAYKCMVVKRSFDKFPLKNRMDWCPITEVKEMEETLKTEERVKPTAATIQKKPKDDDISTYQEYSYMRHPDRVEMGTY